MKKLFVSVICVILAVCGLALSSCGIISELENTVSYPDSYRLSYEVTSAEGNITTVTKAIDKDGNVYYADSNKETVYISDGSAYVRYEKNDDGVFEELTGSKLTRDTLESETSGIKAYAEVSKMKHMPTAKKEGDKEMLGRTCEVYKLGVGNKDNSSYHYYYVDKETGICMGVEVKNIALGNSVAHNGESFICAEFTTDNVENISEMIVK